MYPSDDKTHRHTPRELHTGNDNFVLLKESFYRLDRTGTAFVHRYREPKRLFRTRRNSARRFVDYAAQGLAHEPVTSMFGGGTGYNRIYPDGSVQFMAGV